MHENEINFEINEIVNIKGLIFKIALVDAGTRKMCLKQISKEEAAVLKEESEKG